MLLVLAVVPVMLVKILLSMALPTGPVQLLPEILGLGIAMLIFASIYREMLRVSFGTGILLWFVQLLVSIFLLLVAFAILGLAVSV